MSTGIEKTIEWFQQAIPEPTKEQASIQIGCHLEEVSEMLWSMSCKLEMLDSLSESFKKCNKMAIFDVQNANRNELLDALCDQIVTAVGVAHMMGFDIIGALNEVNRSNFSKFENDKPVFNEYGKIAKGKDYTKPNLEPFIGK